MNSFYDQLQKTITDSPLNRSVTENGAIGYKTTGRKILDINFAVSSLRSKSEAEVEAMFAEACGDDLNTAIVWLFMARDARGGMGERRLFRIGINYLAREFPDKIRKLLPLIAEYGRWDDLWCLLWTTLAPEIIAIVKDQLANDMAGMKAGKSISILPKWLPSLNTSSAATVAKAEFIRRALRITPRQYRKMLSALRKYIDVTERKMSANQWENIKYEAVPSRANLVYNSAFLRHDEERRREYLGKLEKGETKINASVLFPHDIVHKYMSSGWGNHVKDHDQALESMWKALPNTVKDGEGTIVVADGSGSMTDTIGKTQITAWEVAHALAIYFAERLPVPYKDQYITFSSQPQLVKLGGAGTLRGKLQIAEQHYECSNTNIEAVFDLILGTAISNKLTQNEMPKNVLIISDLEFDSATNGRGWGCNFRSPSKALFDEIALKYRRAGYQLPRLVFWNVNSRTGTIPVKENDLGVALVSGFSPNVAKMVMSGKLDPMDALMDALNAPRYDAVREALK